ncbi:MAG: ThiF family adenylyltransferase [Ktedonobacterales bacterium]|nr:ThiF family adenylyltransferase [Ktedonobacterales bacterium]
MQSDGRMMRYARQRVFAPIGGAGQERLAAARVAVVGCGALGTHLADMLARAGVGHLILIDRDVVEWSNLQRQMLFDEADADAGTPKASAAANRLRMVNADITIEPRVLDLDAEAARELVGEVDLVLDGSDAFETRYLINDACVEAGIPWIYSAVVGAEGMTLNCHAPLVDGTRTPCLRCVWPDPLPPGSAATCDTVGVLNGAVSMVTGMAATEALKILLGSAAISPELRSFDQWAGTYEAIALPRDPDCPTCARGEYDWLDGAALGDAARLCGQDTIQIRPERLAGTRLPAIDLAAVAGRWRDAGTVQQGGDAFVRLRVAPFDLTLFSDGRALIRGTSDPATARSLYARYVGM